LTLRVNSKANEIIKFCSKHASSAHEKAADRLIVGPPLAGLGA